MTGMMGTWISLFLLVIFIAPGAHHQKLRRRRYAAKSESVLSETSSALITSTIVAVPSALIVGAIWAMLAGNLPDFVDVLAGNVEKVKSNLSSFLILILFYLSVAFAIIHLFNWYRQYRTDGNIVDTHSMWWKVFKMHGQDDPKLVMATVNLKSGVQWFGEVENFSADLELVDREIVLRPPIMCKAIGNEKFDDCDDYDAVILKGQEIDSIAVEYLPNDDDQCYIEMRDIISLALSNVIARLEDIKRGRENRISKTIICMHDDLHAGG